MGFAEENIHEVSISGYPDFPRQSSVMKVPGRPAYTNTHLTVKSSLWYLVSDSLPPQDAKDLADDLGIELDTAEHSELEKSSLCVPVKRR